MTDRLTGAEIEHLKRERDALRIRERQARAEAEKTQERLAHLASTSKAFALSVRDRAGERRRSHRRLAVQYAVNRVLAKDSDLEEAAPKILEIFGEGFEYKIGVFWAMDDEANVLRCGGVWRSSDASPGSFEEACLRTSFARGAPGLPARVWASGEAVWVENLLEDEDPRAEVAAGEALRGGLAFPVHGGSFTAVFEFFDGDVLSPDEDLLQMVSLVGDQIGQFAERRRSEEELLALKNTLAVDLSTVTHLHELSTRLLATSTLRPLLEEVLNATIELQGADFGNVQLYNQQTGELEIVAQRGFDQEFLDYFSSVVDNGDSACSRAMKRRERVIVEDVEADPDYESLRQIAAAAGYRAVQSTPLFDRNGELLGMLSTHFRRPHRPSERELRLTDLYAGQAAEIIGIRVVEEKLRRQSQLIKTITDNAASCLFMMDRQGHPTFMNPAAEAVTGFTLDEIEDKPIHDAIHHTRPDGTPYPISECPFNRPLLSELPEDLEPIHDHEDVFIRKDGTFFPVSCSVSPLVQDGETVGAVMDFSDITKRKEAEEALRKSEERFRTFFHTAAVGASQADPATGRFLLVNGKFCQLLGYDEDELLSMTFSQVTHPEDRARDAEGLSRLLRDEIREYITEKRYVRKDGRILWVQLARALVRDKDGHPLHTSAIVQDITERKRTEEALRESEELYRLIAENSTDMISKHTHEGVYTYASPACRSLLGYEPQELVGRSAYDFFHPEDLKTISETHSTILRQSDTRTVAYRIRRKDESYVWFETTSRTVRDPETGEVQEILAVSRDITERKRAEEERERFLAREWIARAQAEERRRISRELHDRVAHSIAIVHQNLELHGALKGRDPAMAEAKMESARETAKEALALTRDLSVELRDREVQRGLEAAIKNLARDIVPPTVRCEFPIEGDETLVPLDARNQLFLILREAVRNAVTHSGCDRLTIELDITPQRVAGTVEDNGRGFDADEERSGSGLKSMEERAALLGGTFGVSSKPGAGTKIKVSVPLEDA